MPPLKRRRIASETLEIYAPIAERLGLYAVKLELEDLGFLALYPYRYKVLERELKKARGHQKEFVKTIAAAFTTALAKASVTGSVEGREKHLYSIYSKMRAKGISLHEMVDVYGFRVIVDGNDTCYRTLGLVHSLYKPMPGRFKDYIAIPRTNGYQSLHTTLFGPNGIPIEVQIRSEAMHRVAESGIAAHWKYKSGETSLGGVEQDRAREWLAGLVQIQEGGSSEEFLESVKVDLFPDKVYLFTPKGNILRLPTGATPVDFAYAIHTDIGNRCVAAKVDRRLVPLRTQLLNGQTVEVSTPASRSRSSSDVAPMAAPSASGCWWITSVPSATWTVAGIPSRAEVASRLWPQLGARRSSRCLPSPCPMPSDLSWASRVARFIQAPGLFPHPEPARGKSF